MEIFLIKSFLRRINLKLLSALFASLLIAPSTLGSSVISGGLGYSLGDVYDGPVRQVGTTTGDVPIIGFNPPKPLPGLTRYGLILTSRSKKIVEIWAWHGDMGSSAACREGLARLETAFDRKYEAYKNTFSIGDMTLYSDNGNKIKINCPISFGADPLYLQYTSEEMEKIRLQETLDAEDYSDI